MDITITLTDEQVAALSELSQTRRGQMNLRRMGVRRSSTERMSLQTPPDPNADPVQNVTTYVTTLFEGLADEHIRRNEIMAQRKKIIDEKTKDNK